ncbi:MAG TPA: discoidin domain-containing protein [Roseiflexaceae bacterium]|nr:discoidin domain-containing protein [Roseiflexaceae bacterium]
MSHASFSPLGRSRSNRLRHALLIAALLLASFGFVALPSQAAPGNLALNRPTTASSFESAAAYPAAAAVDGSSTTRWASAWSDPQWIQIDLGSSQAIGRVVLSWEGAYGRAYQIQTSNDATTWTTIHSTTTGDGGVDDLVVSGSGRYIRLYGTQRANGYGYSLWEFEVYAPAGATPTATATPTRTATPTPVGCGTTNVARGRTATASSTVAGNTPALAVDGNAGTRWESAFSDPQWLQIDLGTSASICRVRLSWEGAYASAYQIQTSPNGSTWTMVATTTGGDGGVDDLSVSGGGRYIRVYGTARGTGYGYSLWEVEVYTGGSTPTATPTATATPTRTPTATPTPGENWTTIWSEDFSGPANSAPSTASWQILTGTQHPGGPPHYGSNGVDTKSTANVALDGSGRLGIRASRDAAGSWTSGRLESQRSDFAAGPGEKLRITAVVMQPNPANALGYWPAIRLTGAAYRGNYQNWPSVGEIDLLANVNGRSQLSQGLHCGTAPGGVCNEYTGRSSGLLTCPGCQTAFHEYSVIIDRSKTDEEVRFYLDGAQTWIVRQSQVGVAAWQAAIQHGFFLTIDLAIGGDYPNAIAGVTTPTEATSSGGVLSVDSITVAKTSGPAPAPMTDPPVPAGPSVVRVAGTQGNWQLLVNGTPFLLKGITYGPPQDAGEAYMRDLRDMGVNTIRIWGVDDVNTPKLLDTAARFGIKVVVGHWLNQGTDYVNDTAYKTNVKAEIVRRVNALKGHQGVLLWDVGNEVLLTAQDHSYPSGVTVEQVRVAYAQFVNEVAVAIHAADPNHPVTSTDAWTGAWPYYKNHSPALDLLALNAYGAIGSAKQDWINGGYTKPYIITEGGPAGEWEVQADINGVPNEPTDLQKRDGYTASWNAVLSHPGVALGATEFHYGLENDFGGVWLNTFNGGWHRLGYYALRQAYGGLPAANTPPQITAMTVGSQTAVPAGGQFTVSVNVTDPDGDPLRYTIFLSDKHISGNTAFRHATFIQTGPTSFSVTAPQQMGVWKVYVYAFDGKGNVGIETRSFRVVAPPVAGTNLALNRPATASSFQPTGPSGPQPPGLATDGNMATRWASDWSDPQWIQVDLGRVAAIRHIQLAWESAYARAYQVQVSSDGAAWTTVYATASGDGGFDGIDLNTSGRYVRVAGTQRGTTYGYSLWELGVYGQ